MKVSVFLKGKSISIPVKRAGFFRRGLGLTFRTRNTSSLLFDFEKYVTWQGTLTSFFVFFPFLAIWLDDKNRVIDSKIVKPFIFSIRSKRKFYKIVEIPINLDNMYILKKFVSYSKLKKYYRR